jgi:small conductance mechanosensitive channel
MNVDRIYTRAYEWLILSGPRMAFGMLILVVGFWLVYFIARLLRAGMHKRNFNPSLKLFLSSLIVLSLRIVVVIAVMEVIGLHLTVFSALIASLGVAFGLALSGTLQNFASGVLILVLKPFEVGDNIIAQGIQGTVSSIEIFFTIVTTADNKTIIFPNSKLSNEVITNITRIGNRRLDILLKFTYGVDVQHVKEIIHGTVDASVDILKNPECRIGISELQADGYQLMVNVWVNAHGYEDTKMIFQEKLLSDLINIGIKLPGMEV